MYVLADGSRLVIAFAVCGLHLHDLSADFHSAETTCRYGGSGVDLLPEVEKGRQFPISSRPWDTRHSNLRG